MKSLIKESLNDDSKAKPTERLNNIIDSSSNDIHDILQKYMEQSKAKIFVIGAGGAGNNTI